MNYSEDCLRDIETLAKKMMKPTEIAFILGLNEIFFVDDINTVGHPARRAYKKGVAMNAMELRENTRDAALAGSPFSIAESQKLIEKQLNCIAP